MDERNLTYQIFEDRETWLKAREETIGASSLAHFIATGQLPSPPPDIPAVQSALQFGSIWEPMLVQLYATHLQLAVADKNTPVNELKNGQLAWYDNSFYTDGRLHVSLDAAYRDHDGIVHTVEVKTGSKPSYAFLNTEQRKQYSAQAQIEARMMDTEHAEIIYAQRPPSWETMNAEYITERIKETLDIVIIPDVMDASELERYATEYEQAAQPTDADNGGQRLLAELLEAKDQYETLKGQLATWLEEHPGERVACSGHVARLAETTRTTTDYKAYFSQHPADLTPFQKTSTTTRLSVVKEKKNA
nr:MAG: alkaline exonuclease [Bacteriophage sp.]